MPPKTTALKTRIICIKFTPEQYDELEATAARCGLRLSTWIRTIAVHAANEKVRKGYLRIPAPNGAMT